MRILGVLFVAAFCALGGCSEAKKFTSADEKKIRTELDEWARALTAKEWGKVASLYTEDAVLMPPHTKTIVGRKAIEAFLTRVPAHGGLHDQGGRDPGRRRPRLRARHVLHEPPHPGRP